MQYVCRHYLSIIGTVFHAPKLVEVIVSAPGSRGPGGQGKINFNVAVAVWDPCIAHDAKYYNLRGNE